MFYNIKNIFLKFNYRLCCISRNITLNLHNEIKDGQNHASDEGVAQVKN